MSENVDNEKREKSSLSHLSSDNLDPKNECLHHDMMEKQLPIEDFHSNAFNTCNLVDAKHQNELQVDHMHIKNHLLGFSDQNVHVVTTAHKNLLQHGNFEVPDMEQKSHNQMESCGNNLDDDDVELPLSCRRPRSLISSLASDQEENFAGDHLNTNVGVNNDEVRLRSRGPRFFLHSLATLQNENETEDEDEGNGSGNNYNDYPEYPLPSVTLEETHGGPHRNPPISRQPTPYVVPADDTILYRRHEVQNNQMVRCPDIPSTQSDGIAQAISIHSSFWDQPILHKYPHLTKRRFFNGCFLFIIILVIALVISTQLQSGKSLSKSNNIMTNTAPTEVPSLSPTFAPLIWDWTNETLINIDVEREDLNGLMGYSVSISDDGNTLAVSGRQTLHIYDYIDESWIKVVDSTDLISSNNTMDNLSWATVVCLSSDGNHMIIGDHLANGIHELGGAAMVFSKSHEEKESEWHQVGSTIYGEVFFKYGGRVVISGNGNRIAVSTSEDGKGYAAVYDYDESVSDWIEKITFPGLYFSGGSIAMSSNGKFFALQNAHHIAAEIYDLTTFTQLQILVGPGETGFGDSMSFSRDASILTISDVKLNQVHLYHYNSQKQRYTKFTSPISVTNVVGFGQSIAVSGNGRSLVVGAVSPPSFKLLESGSRHSENYVWWKDMISEHGSVYMFQIENSEWVQVAMFERNSTLYEKIGWTVSVSDNGKVVAFGSYGTGSKFGDGEIKSGQVGIYRSE